MRHLFFVLCAAALSLTACTSVKSAVGLERRAPDEFAVLKRAPLTVPPALKLPTPQPGTARPQESAQRDIAQQTVFGADDGNSDLTSGQQAFLGAAQVNRADPSIRQRLSTETLPVSRDDIPVSKRLMFWKSDEELAGPKTIDPVAESEALERPLPGADRDGDDS